MRWGVSSASEKDRRSALAALAGRWDLHADLLVPDQVVCIGNGHNVKNAPQPLKVRSLSSLLLPTLLTAGTDQLVVV